MAPTHPSGTTVYFDGACPVCRREIAHYRKQRGAAAVTWVDVADCPESALGDGLDRRAALGRFHVRDRDGTLRSGADAFAALWRQLPAYAWLGRAASWRPVLMALDAAYALFLRARRLWRRADPASTTPTTGKDVA